MKRHTIYDIIILYKPIVYKCFLGLENTFSQKQKTLRIVSEANFKKHSI